MMKEYREKIISQLSKAAVEGIYGESAALLAKQYNNLPNDFSRLTKFIQDLFAELLSAPENEASLTFNFWQTFIIVYRECKKKDEIVAKSFLWSFIEDFPETHNSALTSRWNSLIQSIFAFKSVAYLNYPLLSWQQASRLFCDYNEFLNGLLGYFITCWQCALERKVEPGIFSASYAVKAKLFRELTNGENGIFYLFDRIIKPDLRNGIAHGNAWLDTENEKVCYTDGKKGETKEIGLLEFYVFCMIGSQLARSFSAAMSTITVWEYGEVEQKLLLPLHFVKMLSF